MRKSSNNAIIHNSCSKLTEFSTNLVLSVIPKSKISFDNREFISKDSGFEKIQYILAKTQRSVNELLVVKKYLGTLPDLISLLSESTANIGNLLSTISYHLKYERIPPNTIICRLGEVGDKFYIILNGTVSILIPKEIQVNLTIFEYVRHLLLLMIIEEKGLLDMTMKQNNLAYPIEIDTLVQFLNNYEKNNVTLLNFDIVDIIQLQNYVALIKSKCEKSKQISEETIDEYIKKSLPQYIYASTSNSVGSELIKSNHTKLVSLFILFEVNKLNQGATFGERALISTKNKRTGTIISNGVVSLGTLTRKNFNLCIKDIHKRLEQANIRFIQSFQVFSSLSWNLLNSKFLNFFNVKTFAQNQMVIEENNEMKEIYFIREGEFEITAKMSEEDIDHYIKIFTDDKKKYKYKPTLDKKKMKLRIALFKERDIIGLDDMAYKDKYIFSARCISLKAIVFSIEVKAFETILKKVKDVRDNWTQFIFLRKKMFASRFESYRYIKNTPINDNGAKENREIEKVRQCFSARPKSKSRQKLYQNTHMSPIKNQKLFISIANTEGNACSPLRPYVTNFTQGNVCDEIGLYKTRNNRPLSHYQTYALTTANIDSLTSNIEECLAKKNNKLEEFYHFSRKSKRKVNLSREPLPNFKCELYLKKILGSSYKKPKKKQILLHEMISNNNYTKSISKDKEPMIDPLDYDRLNTQRNNHVSPECFEKLDRVPPHRKRILSPKQLPLNYMDKAKPLRLRFKNHKRIFSNKTEKK